MIVLLNTSILFSVKTILLATVTYSRDAGRGCSVQLSSRLIDSVYVQEII